MADAKKITAQLFKRYPRPRLALTHSKPLELLVATILSTQCTDARVNEVTKDLFKKYRAASHYADASPKTFEAEIKPTGFYRNKARMIINCCKKLLADFGGTVPDTLEALVTLPGVGRKTANIVLGNAFGKQEGIAVDTHVLRVSNRLGLANAADPQEVERSLMKRIPRSQWTAFSNAMILHGREICTARRPRCAECVLFDECEWPEKTVASSE